jgi:hypothetical protein
MHYLLHTYICTQHILKRLLELCGHAGITDTLLQTWDGISANQALGKPPAETKLVGRTCVCHVFDELAPYLSHKDHLLDFLEYSEMGTHVHALVLKHNVPFPIRFASQMTMSIPNRGIPPNYVCRDHDTTFRAKKVHYGKPWYDTIRYNYELEDPDGGTNPLTLAYGRCVCFLEDHDEVRYVVLRCYNPYIAQVAEGGVAPTKHVPPTLDRVAQLVPLHLAAVGETYSYMLVKEAAIINGGFILEDPHVTNKHWVQQGCREARVFQKYNGGE